MSEEKSLTEYSFEDLNINDDLLRGIYSYGFEKPSNIQYKSLPIFDSGKDMIAQSQSLYLEVRVNHWDVRYAICPSR